MHFYVALRGMHARLEILTTEDVLIGDHTDRPLAQTRFAFKPAPKANGHAAEKRVWSLGSGPPTIAEVGRSGGQVARRPARPPRCLGSPS